jgi:hypothetical protein
MKIANGRHAPRYARRLNGVLRIARVLRGAAATCMVIACRAEPADPHGTLVAELRIGQGETSTAFQFTQISQMIAGTSAIYVTQRGDQEIRMFDFQGRHVRTIGRAGSGPGEFDALASIGLIGDTLWTIDTNLRRISLFNATDGALITAMRYKSEVPDRPTAGNLYFPYPERLLADGTMLGFGGTFGSAIASGQVTHHPTLRLTIAGATVDTLAWVPLAHASMIIRGSSRQMYTQQPFSDAVLVEYATNADRIYVIDRTVATSASPAEYAVTAIGTNGDTLWSQRYPYVPRRLDGQVADSIRARAHRAYSGQGFTIAEIDDALFVPDFMTPVTAAVAGEDGTLWLRREDARGPAEYDVIDPDGRARGRITSERNARLRWVSGDVAWGEELDADDVPVLVRYRVVWP